MRLEIQKPELIFLRQVPYGSQSLHDLRSDMLFTDSYMRITYNMYDWIRQPWTDIDTLGIFNT